MSQRPNIIYFNPDEMHGDLISCADHPLVKTPNFDCLAKAGTHFDNCHVQHTLCSPSRCGPLTDVAHGASPPRGDPHYNSFLCGPSPRRLADAARLDQALDYLRSRKGKEHPFFLFLALTVPHCPVTYPEPYYSMFDPEDLPDLRPADIPKKPSSYSLIQKNRSLEELSQAELKRITAVYLGMIVYVDDLLGQLIACMEEEDLSASAAVFDFSDHGDWAGDYGLVEKRPSGMDDCLTRVPMIVKPPKGEAFVGGSVIDTPIECLDIITPTLGLAGIECQNSHFGVSMLPQLQGEPGDPDPAVCTEEGCNPNEPRCFEGYSERDAGISNPESICFSKINQQQAAPHSVSRARSIRTATHRYVKKSYDQDELYDLVADPQNLIDYLSHESILADLKERMLEWYINTSDVVPFVQDDRGFPSEHALGVKTYQSPENTNYPNSLGAYSN